MCDTCGEAYKERLLCSCENLTDLHRRRIFSLSLGDWLDPEVPVEWLARMLDTIRQCPDVDWLLCTKRPEEFQPRMFAAWQCEDQRQTHLHGTPRCDYSFREWLGDWYSGKQAPHNVWTLTSIEDQRSADERIPHALAIPSVVRGLSLEPLLGPVNLAAMGWLKPGCINWTIIGGESGPDARPCKVEWVWSLVRQGEAAGVPVFVKQLGAHVIDDGIRGADTFPPDQCWPDGTRTDDFNRVFLSDSKGGDQAEWPEDLRVREWPKGRP